MMGQVINLPQAEITIKKKMQDKKKYLLVAGGRRPDYAWLQQAAQGKIIVCADKGVSYCRQSGLVPHYLLGDGDSALADFSWAEGQNVQVQKYAVDKDDTDLKLALDFIQEQNNASELLITGIWSGRFDHLYSAVFTILNFRNHAQVTTFLADEREIMCLASLEDNLLVAFCQQPKAISLLPLSDQVKLTLTGTKWQLTKKLLKKNNPYAISNELKNNEKVSLKIHSGQAGFYACFSSSEACI